MPTSCTKHQWIVISVILGLLLGLSSGCKSLKIVSVSPSGKHIQVILKGNPNDVTEELKSMLLLAETNAVDSITFSAGWYRISAPLTLYNGLTLGGIHRDSVVVEQLTWGYPAFDVLDTDSTTIHSLTIRSLNTRTYPNGFYSRGTDGYVNNAAIYSNSHNGTFTHLSLKGFTCGIFLSSWNGIGLYEQKRNNTISDVVVDSVDFGILVTGQKLLQVSDVTGRYLQQTGSGGAPHLIYISDAIDAAHVWTQNFIIKNCTAYNSHGGHAFQIGSARDGAITSLRSHHCTGILAAENVVNVTFDTLIATADQTHTVGSVFMQPENISSVKMTHVRIQSEKPESLLLLLDGTGNVYKDVTLESALIAAKDQNLVVFKGSHSSLINIKSFSVSNAAGAVPVMLEGDHLVLDGIECNSCWAAFNVHASCQQCSVKVNPQKIHPAQGIENFVLYRDFSTGTSIQFIEDNE